MIDGDRLCSPRTKRGEQAPPNDVSYQKSMTGKVVVFCLAGIAVSGAVWSANREQPMAEPSARQEVFEFNIHDGKIVSGSSVLPAHEGDEITLKITSDRSDEVHLHGYDLRAQILPGETATLAFTAILTGRFGLEMHKAHIELAMLEVYPQ
jgi:hypothetical protein